MSGDSYSGTSFGNRSVSSCSSSSNGSSGNSFVCLLLFLLFCPFFLIHYYGEILPFFLMILCTPSDIVLNVKKAVEERKWKITRDDAQ